ncbi:MAG: MarP family serine protease [Nocardioides sp.]|uniref:MarP family serine protease n=1 Tax=Nocardioides sp. TaxID=35761 RepID=UPI0039E45EBC
MNLLDWFLVLVVIAYALSGYWQGFVTGAFATVGLLLGGAFGIWLAPRTLGDAAPSVWVSLGALFIVILSASLGQALFQFLGTKVRDAIRWQPIRAVDAVGGAVLSAVAVLLVAWALGVAVSGSRLGKVTPLVRDSTILGQIDRTLPNGADQLLRAFDNVVGTSFFPRYLEPFAPERIVAVEPGPKRLLTDPDVLAAGDSIAKIRGVNVCKQGIEGSGFVYATDRLLTNAHVVAGVREPEITLGDEVLPATVVVYDPDLDIAVLAFDDSSVQPLRLDQAKAGQGVAILGFPQDGPFDVQTARIRAEQRLRSPNIYGTDTVIREVFSLRGTVRPGNSGGPIVDSEGDAVGLVFAASVNDPQTGYALTADQLKQSAALGISSSRAVSTQGCAQR